MLLFYLKDGNVRRFHLLIRLSPVFSQDFCVICFVTDMEFASTCISLCILPALNFQACCNISKRESVRIDYKKFQKMPRLSSWSELSFSSARSDHALPS